jgi:predicted nuclease of predicted toxin-antitoxin system
MKLLLDQNLSSKLVERLIDLYPGSTHVDAVGLGDAPDGAVWDYAKSNRFAIVSKDSDFADRSVLDGAPPKIVWIRIGNCRTSDVEKLLRSQFLVIRDFLQHELDTCLLLGRKA